ncbi:hypothetical protein [Sphingomonas aerolata]|uniref:hypothetical protein n=1 Tax=Sphingomonas aerolata TaxID=185951 RepID=UPI00208EE094|nr:hypothetical protein [Sphingomonas aerolata]USQ99543.1 hypothetical protein NEF64_14120 [Sphingomonas aerolata]
MDMHLSPTVAAQKARLTEQEARAIGTVANRIVNLRGLVAAQAGAGTITVGTKDGPVSLSIPSEEVVACLAFLVERHESFLSQFDIELENTTALRA